MSFFIFLFVVHLYKREQLFYKVPEEEDIKEDGIEVPLEQQMMNMSIADVDQPKVCKCLFHSCAFVAFRYLSILKCEMFSIPRQTGLNLENKLRVIIYVIFYITFYRQCNFDFITKLKISPQYLLLAEDFFLHSCASHLLCF